MTVSIKENFDKIAAHEGNKSNPHNVTAAQVGAAPAVHNHNDLYYTKSEVDNKDNAKANTSHTHTAASTTVDGFMSKADKTKLDGISAGANVSPVNSVNGKTGVVVIGANDLADVYSKGEVDSAVGGKANTSHNHGAATASADGFMSKADKSKLDGIAAGAQTNAVSSVNGKTGAVVIGANELSDVFSKTEVNNLLGGKAPTSHTHTPANITQDASNRFTTDTEKTRWNRSSDQNDDYNQYCSVYDGNGIATVVEWKRSDGKLYRKSVLSNKDANDNYLKSTVTYYAANGTTVTETQNWTYAYDADGNKTSEVKA